MSPSIKRWIVGFIIIIIVLSAVVYYYRYYYHRYQIDDFSSISDEGAKNITRSFLNNSSLTQYHANNVTEEYRKERRATDSRVNLYDQSNNPTGWVLISGNNAKIEAININWIELYNRNFSLSFYIQNYDPTHVYSKITSRLWKKISTSNNSSYCHCVLNLMQPFSEEETNLLAKNQNFEIEFQNSTAILGIFPINKINDIINNDKIKSIDYVE
jgi:hypothetical protein